MLDEPDTGSDEAEVDFLAPEFAPGSFEGVKALILLLDNQKKLKSTLRGLHDAYASATAERKRTLLECAAAG
jgi:hypothetical protein